MPAYSVLITGEKVSFIDFSFLANWLSDNYVQAVGHTISTDVLFENFIVSLMNIIVMTEKTKNGRLYMRIVDFHKLEEEDVNDRYSHFFRHCVYNYVKEMRRVMT